MSKEDKKNIFKTEISVFADIKNATKICEMLEKICTEAAVPFNVITQCNVAIDEIFSNIVYYGYGEEKKDITVKVLINFAEQKNYLQMTFIDSAIKFNPLEVSAPDTTLAVEDRQIGGLGIFMVCKMMDDVSYEYKNGCNHLSFMKYF